MPVQIEITTDLTDTLITVINDSADQWFSVTVPGKVNDFIFDPDEWLMKDVSEIVGVDDDIIVSDYKLFQNYPNPFNPITQIKFSILKESHVKLMISDILGNLITTLLDEIKPSGLYEIKFDGTDLSSGIYFYQIIIDKFIESKKMTLIK